MKRDEDCQSKTEGGDAPIAVLRRCLTSMPSHAVASFVAYEPPPGFSTVPRWWAEKMPEELEVLSMEFSPLSTFCADSDHLQDICDRRGIEVKVLTPRLHTPLGVADNCAFPDWLLADFYPVNP